MAPKRASGGYRKKCCFCQRPVLEPWAACLECNCAVTKPGTGISKCFPGASACAGCAAGRGILAAGEVIHTKIYIIGYRGQEKRSELYSADVAYCMGVELKYEARNVFFNALRIKGHAEKTVKGNHMFYGVSLKDCSAMSAFTKKTSAISSPLM